MAYAGRMPDALAPPRLVPFKDACAALGVSIYTGYEYARAGTFPVPIVRIGSRMKVRRTDLDRFLDGE